MGKFIPMQDLKISKRKPSFPITEKLHKYLKRYDRDTEIPINYDDLLRFQGSIVVYDKDDNDTLWIRVYYNEYEREEIDASLKKVYSILHSDGNINIMSFLNVDAIDYCTFGNSKPFRIKVRNILNDNYTYFYVKTADASRVYGLELEHMLSPYNLNFLGDMRSYNYVIVPTHDFDHVVYKIRPIDFDQQSYEGKFNIYRPQFFKENLKMVELVSEGMQKLSIDQYKTEERSILVKRLKSFQNRIGKLLDCMVADSISKEENIDLLKFKIFDYTQDVNFKRCKNMGQILKFSLEFLTRNYENVKLENLR